MNTVVITLAMTVFVMVLLYLLFKKSERTHELESQLDHARKEVQGITDAIKKTKKVEAEAEKPATVPPAAAGDAASRLDRLNKL